jgi:hypothetical protein
VIDRNSAAKQWYGANSLFITINELFCGPQTKSGYLYRLRFCRLKSNYAQHRLTLDEFLNQLDKDIKKKILFNLDLFYGEGLNHVSF